MKLTLVTGEKWRGRGEAIIACVVKGTDFSGIAGAAELKKSSQKLRFKGAAGEMFFAFKPWGEPAKHLLVAGLGEAKELTPAAFRSCVAGAVRKLRERYCTSANLAFYLPKGYEVTPADVEAAAEGAVLGNRPFQEYITDADRKFDGLKELMVYADQKGKGFQGALDKGKTVGEATVYARDLVSHPSNYLTPTKMAEEAKKLAGQFGFKVKVYGRKECEKMGMGAYLAVARGSHEEPAFIHISYRPKGAKICLGLVGKGLTFDTGGISIKPNDGMYTMKSDMSGSAAVMGAMKAVGAMKPKVAIEAVMAMTENMPGGGAYKPGDILKSMSGKTIENLNCDAEGRLTLADALTFVQRQKVDAIIDLATLTGACVVALGPDIAGAMGNDQAHVDAVLAAAKGSGDEMWQLPLPAAYKKMIKSPVADIANSAKTRWGGALTAGLFLKEFIENDTPWVHLDIAGPAYRDDDGADSFKAEGSGVGVRTLVRFILSKE